MPTSSAKRPKKASFPSLKPRESSPPFTVNEPPCPDCGCYKSGRTFQGFMMTLCRCGDQPAFERLKSRLAEAGIPTGEMQTMDDLILAVGIEPARVATAKMPEIELAVRARVLREPRRLTGVDDDAQAVLEVFRKQPRRALQIQDIAREAGLTRKAAGVACRTLEDELGFLSHQGKNVGFALQMAGLCHLGIPASST